MRAARVDGREEHGKAVLETEEVIFRGAKARAKVPFSSMTRIDVEDGWLEITHAKGVLALAIGARAATRGRRRFVRRKGSSRSSA